VLVGEQKVAELEALVQRKTARVESLERQLRRFSASSPRSPGAAAGTISRNINNNNITGAKGDGGDASEGAGSSGLSRQLQLQMQQQNDLMRQQNDILKQQLEDRNVELKQAQIQVLLLINIYSSSSATYYSRQWTK
jgi:hypothetical protein